MDKKIISFIISIILLCLSAFTLYLCFSISDQKALEGLANLALVVTIPVYIIVFLLFFCVCSAGIIFSVKSMSSCVKTISIISIVTLILMIGEACAGVYLLLHLLKVF